MKKLKTLIAFLFVVFCCQTAFSQMRYRGTVVDIVDGKTVVIELEGTRNKITAELQYIDVPDPEQQLSQVIKEHLQKLLLGKTVDFSANQMKPTKLIGQIFAGGVDISQQMLRDGAAWYQSPVENQNYKNVEAQAKTEKLGVWSIAGLKPAWEFRAERAARIEKENLEKENLRKQQEALAEEARKSEAVKVSSRQPQPGPQGFDSNAGMWADVRDFSSLKEASYSSGLFTNYVPFNDVGYIATPELNFLTPAGDNIAKAAFRIGYLYQGKYLKPGQDTFLIAIQSQSKNWAFLETNNLIVAIDGRSLNLGKAHRLFAQGDSAVQEALFYKISKDVLAKIAASKKAELKVGRYSNPVSAKQQAVIKTLLTESEPAPPPQVARGK